MNNDAIDLRIKNAIEFDIDSLEEYKKRVNYTLQYCFNNKEELLNSKKYNKLKGTKSTNIFKRLIAAIVVLTCTFTVYAGVSNNLYLNEWFSKLSKNYEQEKTDIYYVISNEYLDLTVNSIARDSNYSVVDLSLKFTEKGLERFHDIRINENNDCNLGLKIDFYYNDKLFASNDARSLFVDENGGMAPKTDVQIPYINIEKIFDNEYELIYLLDNIDCESDTIDFKMDVKCLNIKYDDVSLFSFDEIESINEIRNDSLDINKTINATIKTKENMKENFEVKEKYLSDDCKIVIQNVLNTKFDTRIDLEMHYICTLNENNERFNRRENYSFNIKNDNDVVISNGQYLISSRDYYIKDIETGEIYNRDYQIPNKEKKMDFVYRTIFKIPNKLITDTLYIYPINYNTPNERTDDLSNRVNSYDWKDLMQETKNISISNELGTTITLDSISITDDEIVFECTKTGTGFGISGNIDLRPKNYNGLSNIGPSKIEYYGENQNNIRFIFDKNYQLYTGTNLNETIKLLNNNIDELEYALYYQSFNEKMYDPIELRLPREIEEKSIIENISFEDYIPPVYDDEETERIMEKRKFMF